MRGFRTGPRRPAAILLAAATMTAFTVTSATGAAAEPPAASVESLYVVQTSGAPAATYNGGVPGLAATRPFTATKLDPVSSTVRDYQSFLNAQHSMVLSLAGLSTGKKVYDYAIVFNGFAARLTAAEAERIRRTPGVVNVWKNAILTGQTFTTPSFVGVDGRTGAWRQRFGGPERAGEGVIVGVLDSGFWPENPSFGALPTPRPDQATINAKWHGTCDIGPESPVACNNKVIGARWFNSGGLSQANPGEFDSPRDFNGHGSHTASTAAGNHGVTATVNGVVAGSISGLAPAARLAIYKVLYANADNSQTTGSTADIVAAINQAVADGVDVINFSIGDDVDSFGPIELAFLNAASAGVFIATAAGNAGPGESTVDNAMPWETTVGAGTHDRGFTRNLTLGDGRQLAGVGVGAALPSRPLVDAANAAAPGANPIQAAQCFAGTLAPAQVAGKVVLCARGGNNRTDKSLAVQQAGGAGMVLYNPTPNTLNADYHFVPSIHVDEVVGAALKAYTVNATATVALGAGTQVALAAPDVAAFSARGPSLSSGGDLLKPDILAPGVDVLAAVAPPGHAGNLWNTNSGTSMATPHIAGIAALLKGLHPTWSPMAVKSALMTTANPLDSRRGVIGDQATGANATSLDLGAGEVAAAAAFDPGLVYDSGPVQWLQYSCGIGVHLTLSGNVDVCDLVGTVDPSDFNHPSLAVGDLAGVQTLRRTVTNITTRKSTYEAKVKAPPGFTVRVTPAKLTIPPKGTASFTVTITRTTAPFGDYAYGSLTWSDKQGHQVRSPIAVRPVPLAGPAEVTGTGTSGSRSMAMRAGFTGTLTATASGLTPAGVTTVSLTGDPSGGFDPANPAPSARTGRVEVNVPAGSKVARFATYATDYAPGTDIDLYVYASEAGDLTLVGQSAGGTADEAVTVTEPGTYVVFFDLFAVPGGTATVPVRHHQFVVPPTNAGNLAVAPASVSVTVGGPANTSVSWTGLTAGQRYLGVVEYGDGSHAVGGTIVAVLG